MSVPYDVNDAFSLEFEDTFDVIRRPLSIMSNGRGRTSNADPVPAFGVVAPAGSAQLQRLSDYELVTKAILVITPFRLYYAKEGFQPDLILYRGDTYVVGSLEDYTQYGRGFVSAVCSLMKANPEEPLENE